MDHPRGRCAGPRLDDQDRPIAGKDDLFAAAGLDSDVPRPLADRLRPDSLDAIVGQDHLLGPGAPLRRMVEGGRLGSLVLTGPPGVGKTTIARRLADGNGARFEQVSAIHAGVADLRKVFDAAAQRRSTGQGTVLFVDEIHRFNKAQQDSLLPVMEEGLVTLIGATTENPSFALNAALLSRAQVFRLRALDRAALGELLARAEAALNRPLPLTDAARAALLDLAAGDGRFLIGLAEELAVLPAGADPLDRAALAEAVQRRMPLYDRAGDVHYDMASVLQKSIRGSDTDAALYWTARMLNGGEDPLFVLRRLTVIASEDIGNADPQALPLAIAAREAYEALGDPEGHIAIGQLVTYLASAPKSNAAYAALKAAKRRARETGHLAPPRHAVNAPTKLMKEWGHGEGYVYDHGTRGGHAGLDYFPEDLERETFYRPTDRGAEKAIAARLEAHARRRADRTEEDG